MYNVVGSRAADCGGSAEFEAGEDKCYQVRLVLVACASERFCLLLSTVVLCRVELLS